MQEVVELGGGGHLTTLGALVDHPMIGGATPKGGVLLLIFMLTLECHFDWTCPC